MLCCLADAVWALQLRRAGEATQIAALKIPRPRQVKVMQQQRLGNLGQQVATQRSAWQEGSRLGAPAASRNQLQQPSRSLSDRRANGRRQMVKQKVARKGPEEELEGLLGNLDAVHAWWGRMRTPPSSGNPNYKCAGMAGQSGINAEAFKPVNFGVQDEPAWNAC
eukprot:1162117-Pelagomonas_calceolata.AAC.4